MTSARPFLLASVCPSVGPSIPPRTHPSVRKHAHPSIHSPNQPASQPSPIRPSTHASIHRDRRTAHHHVSLPNKIGRVIISSGISCSISLLKGYVILSKPHHSMNNRIDFDPYLFIFARLWRKHTACLTFGPWKELVLSNGARSSSQESQTKYANYLTTHPR